jgi:hypothetical protein
VQQQLRGLRQKVLPNQLLLSKHMANKQTRQKVRST